MSMKTKILLCILLILPALSNAGKTLILSNDSLQIPVGQYVVIHFAILPEHAENTQMEGTILNTSTDQEIELLLFHQDDYSRWIQAPYRDVDTLGYVPSLSGNFSFPVDAFGSMSLVISNRGNLTQSTVACSVLVVFDGLGIPDDPIYDALQIFLVMLVITASITVIGVVYTQLAKGKKRG